MQLLKNTWHGLPLEAPDFYGTDNRELFLHNLKIQPEDWIWRNKPVHYSINSQGYRCPEFDKIDWKESILMFGCSYVFAPGVDDSETMSSLIAKNINRPVINLGAGATDDLFQFVNSNIICSQGIKPYAVIYLWPGVHRLSEFEDTYNLKNWGSWNCESSFLAKGWITKDQHVKTMLHYLSLSVKNIWNCPVFEYYPYMVKDKNQRSINIFKGKSQASMDDILNDSEWPTIKPWRHTIDAARDVGYKGNYHPGPRTLQFWVDDIIMPDLTASGIYSKPNT